MGPHNRLNRRELMAAGGLAAAATVLWGCGSGDGGSGRSAGQLRHMTWAGFEDPQLYPGFAPPARKPRFTFFASDSNALSRVTAGQRPDTMHPCTNFLPDYMALEVLEPWDTKKIPNFEHLVPALTKLGRVDGRQYQIPIDWGFESVIYRSDRVRPLRNSWDLLYDERYKGRISWIDSEINLVIAGYVLGVSDPWDMTDAQLEEVKDFLISKKPLVRNLWQSQTEWEGDFARGEVWIVGTAWPDSWVRLRKRKLPVEFMDPEEGRWAWVCGLVLFRESPNKEDAHRFANAWTSKKSALHHIKEFGYGRSTEGLDLSGVDPAVVEAFSLDDLSALEAGNTQFYQHIPRRGQYARTWEQVKVA